MVVPAAPAVAGPRPLHQQVTSCGRCGRRFPRTDPSGPASPAHCEPCRDEMWAADRGSEPLVVPARQCGRCRELFDGDPNLHPQALAEWWVCRECRAVLFGTSR